MSTINKLRLVFDVDGVICDFEEHWKQLAEKVIGKIDDRQRPGHERDWYTEDRYNLTTKEVAAITKALYTSSPEFMPEIEGAVTHLRWLMKEHDVFFATTSLVPNPLWEYGRRRWFERELGSEAARRLIFTRYKYVLAADVFVDDKPQHIQEWKEHRYALAGRHARSILFGEVNGDQADATTWGQVVRMIGFTSKVGADNE